MKPIVEAMGLDWRKQLRRIKFHPVLRKGVSVTDTPSAGGVQKTVALNLEHFHGWLITLDSRRITDKARQALIVAYQERAFRVIFEHFHGTITGHSVSLPPSVRISLQNQAMQIVKKLQGTQNRAERRMMYQMLEGLCKELVIEVPALDELGRDAPDPPDTLRGFWQALETLKERQIDFNHAGSHGTMAISLLEISQLLANAGIPCEINSALKKALRLSVAPRFVARHTVRSAIDGRCKHCWVFSFE